MCASQNKTSFGNQQPYVNSLKMDLRIHSRSPAAQSSIKALTCLMIWLVAL